MKKFFLTDGRPVERGGQHGIEVKQGERRNQEIRLVDLAEFPGLCALQPQKKDAGL
jgi:hypothetical protein